MTDFIKREEFSTEMKSLREDIKEHTADLANRITDSFDRLTSEIRKGELDWRQRTHELSNALHLINLKQAVQEKQIEGLGEPPQVLASLRAIESGLQGVNARLDKVNGRLDKHTAQIASGEAHTQRNAERIEAVGKQVNALVSRMLTERAPAKMSQKAKLAVGAGAGVSALAVIHSLIEMLKSLGPSVIGLFTGK